MRKLVLSVIALTALTTAANAKMFIEPVIINETTEKETYLEKIDMGEIIKDGNYKGYELRIGTSITTYLPTFLGRKPDFSAVAYIAPYWLPKKWDEKGLKIGFKGTWFLDNYPKLGFSIGGQAGLGVQKMKGKTVPLSNGTTAYSFVTEGTQYYYGNDTTQPTTGTFHQDSWDFSYGLDIGAEYVLSKNWVLNAEGSFLKRNYNVGYKVAGSQIENNFTIIQDSWQLKFGIRYIFDWTITLPKSKFVGSMSSPVNMSVFDNGRKY